MNGMGSEWFNSLGDDQLQLLRGVVKVSRVVLLFKAAHVRFLDDKTPALALRKSDRSFLRVKLHNRTLPVLLVLRASRCLENSHVISRALIPDEIVLPAITLAQQIPLNPPVVLAPSA